MTTSEKDFKVKNGIQVADDGVFGGNIVTAEPQSASHVTTKSYVDNLVNSVAGQMPVGGTAPSSPSNGDFWFNTEIERLSVYYEGQWIIIPTLTDSQNIPNHTHDTSIDAGGFLSYIFLTAGGLLDTPFETSSGGDVSTTDWAETYNGGIVQS